MAHQLRPFNSASFQATEKAWSKKQSDATFPTESAQVLNWVAGEMKCPDPSDSSAYGLFEKGSDIAVAVCEVVIKRKSSRSKWVKMVRVRLSPDLDERIYENDLSALTQVVELYAAAVGGVLKLKDDLAATTLKIYGRSAEQLAFLKLLAPALEKHKVFKKGHSIRMDDRWLVVENT